MPKYVSFYYNEDFKKEGKGNAYKISEIKLDIPIIPSAIICTLVNTPRMLDARS